MANLKAVYLLFASLLGITTAATASPTPAEYHKEIGCVDFPATTRTPFCTPQ